jgi:hypothetical protein
VSGAQHGLVLGVAREQGASVAGHHPASAAGWVVDRRLHDLFVQAGLWVGRTGAGEVAAGRGEQAGGA